MSPLKRRPELQALSEDHHNALVIALRCRRVADGSLDTDAGEFWEGVRAFYNAALAGHFEIEERLLLPALDALGETEMSRKIASEHVELRRLAAETSARPEILAAFGRLLDDHVRYEERVVFESVQDRLPASVLGKIAAASAASPQFCPTTLRPLARRRD